MRAYWMMTRAGLRSFRRDRQGVFWSFFFPVFFVCLFGMIFGQSGDRPAPKFDIGLIAPDKSPAAAWVPGVFEKVPVFKLHTEPEAAQRKELLAGKRRAIVIFPPDFGARVQSGAPSGVRVLYDPTNQTSQATAGIIKQVLTGMEQRMSGREPLIQAKDEPVSPGAENGEKSRYVDVLTANILGMTLMQLGIFTAIPLIAMREKGILKRLRATPLSRSALVGSQVTMRLVIAMIQTLVIIALGRTIFGFHVSGSWIALFALVVFGVLTFICMGAVLSSLAKTQESGVSMVQLVNLPMMFLSGIFFPPEILPNFMKPVMYVLPLTYLADALRVVTLSVPSAFSITTDLAVLAGWLVVGVIVAARTFRWE